MSLSPNTISLRPSSAIRLLFLCSSSSSFFFRSSSAIGRNNNNYVNNRCTSSSPFLFRSVRRNSYTTVAYSTASCMSTDDGALEGTSDVYALISSIHASPTCGVVYTTGGASSTVSALLSVPGASRTVLDAGIPYSKAATTELVANARVPVKSFASKEAAIALANAAFRRASYLASANSDNKYRKSKDETLMGIGAACALDTSYARRGDDRAHVAVMTDSCVKTYAIYFAPASAEHGGRRLQQERAASRLALHALSLVGSENNNTHDNNTEVVPEFIKAALIPGDEYVESSVRDTPDLLDSVLSEKIPYAQVTNFGNIPVLWTSGETYANVILPGSFNPVHIGHRHLLKAGVEFLRSTQGSSGNPVTGAYELSVRNADKPALSADVVRSRLSEFEGEERVIVTNAPLFTDKAALYPPGTTFVVGHDTAIRLVMPKYYGGAEEMIREFVKIAMKGCRFLVGARYDHDTEMVKTLDDIDIPYVLKDLFVPIPIEQFREDISSTEIRASRECNRS